MRNLPVLVFDLFVCLLTFACGGDGDGGRKDAGGAGASSRECQLYCKELCAERASCPSPPEQAECVDDCLALAQPAVCASARENLEDTRCDELERQPQCQSYCSKLCARAADCESIDERACAEGCGLISGLLECGDHLVSERSCDEISAEAACHLLIARDEFTSECQSQVQPGVCRSSYDCPEVEACDPATLLCGACSEHAPCGEPDSGEGALTCREGQCERVECVKNDDCGFANEACGGSFCDICDVAQNRCVECMADEHCYGGDRCDTAAFTCVECLGDADCGATFSGAEVCDLEAHECVACLPERCDGICDDLFGCVDCRADTDCLPGWRCGLTTCEVSPTSCSVDADCPEKAYCVGAIEEYPLLGTCTACRSDADCAADEQCSDGTCIAPP